MWIPTVCLAVVVLFSLGFMKATLIGLNKLKSGLETLLLGAFVCGVGAGLGYAFEGGH